MARIGTGTNFKHGAIRKATSPCHDQGILSFQVLRQVQGIGKACTAHIDHAILQHLIYFILLLGRESLRVRKARWIECAEKEGIVGFAHGLCLLQRHVAVPTSLDSRGARICVLRLPADTQCIIFLSGARHVLELSVGSADTIVLLCGDACTSFLFADLAAGLSFLHHCIDHAVLAVVLQLLEARIIFRRALPVDTSQRR